MRNGSQQPTFEHVTEYAYSFGSDVIELFEAYGRRYYGCQKHEIELLCARSDDGRYATTAIGFTRPRQNGKSFGARDYSIDAAMNCGKSVLYTAHRGVTARKMFREIRDFLNSVPDLKAEVANVASARGEESISFHDGGRIDFCTRSNGIRGGTYNVIIVDEAQDMTTEDHEAMLPVISAAEELDESEGAQVIYLGTVPDEGSRGGGEVFRRMHDMAHRHEGAGWWVEFGVEAERLQDIDLDDRNLWYATNPAMGRRMSEETIQNEREKMSDLGFARERLGWWPPAQGRADAALPAQEWRDCATGSPPEGGGVSYGVRFTPDGKLGVLAACVMERGHAPHIELVCIRSMERGIGWFARWLEGRADECLQILIDGKSNAETLRTALLDAGLPRQQVWLADAGDAATAASMLLDAVRSGELTHYDQSQLNESALGSVKRKIGNNGGWGFQSTEEADAAPIEAAALALLAARTTKRQAEGEQFVW